MNKKIGKKHLESARAESIKKYGDKSASMGNEIYVQNVVPSPSLMYDYKSGIGGILKGALTEIFGTNGLGKTSAFGYGVLANVQKQDELPALIAMEPTFDPDWAYKLHGLDPEMLLILRPDNAQEAFEMLYDLVYNTSIDYILLDSIGAMADKSTQKDGGGIKAFGVSGQVTSGLNAVMPRLYKNNQGLMIINQQRQGTGGSPGVTFYESPGGEALKHDAMVRIQLKPGSKKYYAIIEKQKVMVGRQLKCSFKKNKASQAADKSAEFDFYNIKTEEYGGLFGIDRVKDHIDAGMVSGAITKAGGYYSHGSFPDGKLQGIKAARTYFGEHPETFDAIRADVIECMTNREIAILEAKRDDDAD
jgi:recombination protein RecA